MAGGANQSFMKARSEFLRRNFVCPYDLNNALAEQKVAKLGLNNQKGENYGVFEFDIERGGTAGHSYYYESRKLDCYTIRLVGEGRKVGRRTHLIRGYYLPYKNNKTYTVDLGFEAEFFCTPMLDGCSIAMSGSGYYPRISHANSIDPITQLIDRNRIDLKLAKRHATGIDARLDKGGYTNVWKKKHSLTNYQCCVVGFRESGGWEFYYQISELVHARDVLSGQSGYRHQVLVSCQRLR